MKKNTKKKLKLPINAYLSYLLVAALLLSGVTFSKYVTSTNAGDEARAATFGDLSLEEEHPNEFIIAPGVNITKNPVVSFGTGKTSESAAYVFVYVAAPNWKFDEETNTYTLSKTVAETDTTTPLLTWTVDENWKYVTGDNYYKVFYGYVEPNEKLTDVPFIKDSKITVSNELYHSNYQDLAFSAKNITFKAYAVQANGFGSAGHAWDELYYKSLNSNSTENNTEQS